MSMMFVDNPSWYAYHYPKLMEKYDEVVIELSQCRERAERAESELQAEREKATRYQHRAMSIAGQAGYWKLRHDQIAQGNSPAN